MRIAVSEKYRPIYEKLALLYKQNAIQKANIENSKHETDNSGLVNLPNPNSPINTSEKLANIAGVSEKTYRMGAKLCLELKLCFHFKGESWDVWIKEN